MSNLKKNSIENISKQIFQNNTNILIEENYYNKCKIISELLEFFEEQFRKFISIDKEDIESIIREYQEDFIEINRNKDSSAYSYYKWNDIKKYKNKEEYANDQILICKKNKSYFLKKYKPTIKTSKEVIFGEIKLNSYSKADIDFCIFFNEENTFCMDFIYKKEVYESLKDIQKETKTISYKANIEILKLFMSKLKEESNNIEIENKKRKIKQNKVKELVTKGAILNVKEILEPYKNYDYKIKESSTSIDLIFELQKGDISIKIPKRDIKNKLVLLPDLIDLVLKSNEVGIECRYKRT